MDRQRIERCLQQVAAYQASGQRANEWAAANGVSVRNLASWCAHARRWRAQLDGVACEPAGRQRASGFVAAGLPASSSASVRVELNAGRAPVTLHWPISHARELAAWLREVAR